MSHESYKNQAIESGVYPIVAVQYNSALRAMQYKVKDPLTNQFFYLQVKVTEPRNPLYNQPEVSLEVRTVPGSKPEYTFGGHKAVIIERPERVDSDEEKIRGYL